MTQSQRKAIGVALTLLTLVAWAIVGMWGYERLLVGAPGWVHLIYFVAFGLGWMFPAMAVIRWMSKPE
ncbi:DUF2842 domain-containing protein [Pelagibacterium halotolerans]|uniref:DUF2842 domain-containing protein n=1 Tax=Pelagibacterium halotolerans TaxID=531813 RepID=UPI00385105F9